MSTLNKYAAAARCIRRQRILKKNATAYIKLAAEEDRVVPRGGDTTLGCRILRGLRLRSRGRGLLLELLLLILTLRQPGGMQ